MAALWELRDRRARMIGVEDSKLREDFLKHVVEVQRGVWDLRDLARARGASARAAVDEIDAYVGYVAVVAQPMTGSAIAKCWRPFATRKREGAPTKWCVRGDQPRKFSAAATM